MELYIDKYFPGLALVGEEDMKLDIKYDENKYKFLTEITEVDLNIIKADQFIQNEYEFKEITLFIDPIDATFDFIKKNYEVVTSLVGVVYKDSPLAGLVHYPFYEGEVNNKSISFFNIPGNGIYEYHTYSDEMQKHEVMRSSKFQFSCSVSKVTPQIEQSM